MSKNRKRTGFISAIVVCLFLIATSLVVVAYRQRILDQIAFWSYKPTPAIASLADRAGLNDNGKFYFYASQPVVYNTQTASDFNRVCDKVESTTAILGCYNGSRIFIYDVKDKKLDGINEVTAAHETLHAIYARLQDREKDKIDKLIEAEYKKIAGDKYYSDLVDYYAAAEPGQRNNELHSIIGTEVANISPDLEKYYDRYFSNRQDVVDLDIKYSNVFKNLKTKADKLSLQLDSLSVSISDRTKQYNADATALNKDIALFNTKAANGDFSTQAQFDSERATLVGRVSALEKTRLSIKADVSRYETILNEYNSIATQSKKLYDTINSTLVSSPSV